MSAEVDPKVPEPGTGGGFIYPPRIWSGGRNKNGWSTYNAQFLVLTTDTHDGPDTVLLATGLPAPGDPWQFGNDDRPDVVCLPQRSCKVLRAREHDPGHVWTVDTEWSNDAAYNGPIISINGQKYTKEVFRDRFGRILCSTSFELFRGPQAEFDFNRIAVEIEYPKKLTLDLPLWTVLANSGALNSGVMWGLPARCVKMEPYSVQEKWDEEFGKYYGVTFRFTTYVIYDKDGNPTSGFDREVLNEGTKALGTWRYPTSNIIDAEWDNLGGNSDNPQHYYRYYTKDGNIARVILLTEDTEADEGSSAYAGQKKGEPWDGVHPPADSPPSIHFEHYPEADLVGLLDIPDPLYPT